MSIPPRVRELVRQRANYCCEFCGIHENDAGGELTVDHYRPQGKGGSDDPSNLIYACNRCNLYKHDYWPDSRSAPRLWNPRLEPFKLHFIELSDGTVKACSPTGAFTLHQLRLNRPQLVVNRRRRHQLAESQKQLEIYRGTIGALGQLLVEQSALANQQTDLLQELRELLAELIDSRR